MIACVGQKQPQGLEVDDKELFEQSREEEKNDGVRPYDESEALSPIHGDEKRVRLQSNQLTLVTSQDENSSAEVVQQENCSNKTKSFQESLQEKL